MLPADFPSEEVFEAYLHPVVDESTELFEWGKPDLHSLRLYPLNSKVAFTDALLSSCTFLQKSSFLCPVHRLDTCLTVPTSTL